MTAGRLGRGVEIAHCTETEFPAGELALRVHSPVRSFGCVQRVLRTRACVLRTRAAIDNFHR